MKEIYSDYLMKLFDEKAKYRINEEMDAEIEKYWNFEDIGDIRKMNYYKKITKILKFYYKAKRTKNILKKK